MRIQFISGVAGERFAYYPGEVHDLPEAEADSFLSRGIAMAAAPLPAVVRRRRGAKLIATHMVAGAPEDRG